MYNFVFFLTQDPSIFNQIPRDGGKFFNLQANTYANHAGVTFIKIAMFDEVDEGIYIFSRFQNNKRNGNFKKNKNKNKNKNKKNSRKFFGPCLKK